MATPSATDRLLTPGEAARRLGVTTNTLLVWTRSVRALRGAVVRARGRGRHRRYRESVIEAFRRKESA